MKPVVAVRVLDLIFEGFFHVQVFIISFYFGLFRDTVVVLVRCKHVDFGYRMDAKCPLAVFFSVMIAYQISFVMTSRAPTPRVLCHFSSAKSCPFVVSMFTRKDTRGC